MTNNQALEMLKRNRSVFCETPELAWWVWDNLRRRTVRKNYVMEVRMRRVLPNSAYPVRVSYRKIHKEELKRIQISEDIQEHEQQKHDENTDNAGRRSEIVFTARIRDVGPKCELVSQPYGSDVEKEPRTETHPTSQPAKAA